MNGALTLPKVRHLVRLYRHDLEGSAEQLKRLLRERRDELHPLLAITAGELERLCERGDAVQALARSVEDKASEAAHARASALHDAADRAATALAKAAVLREGGVYQLPLNAMRKLVALSRGSGEVAFSDRGVVDASRLRALVQRCARVDSTTITVTARKLVVAYSTARSRGVIGLLLHPRRGRENDLVVPIPTQAVDPTFCRVIFAPPPWPADDAQHAGSPRPPLPPQRPALVRMR